MSTFRIDPSPVGDGTRVVRFEHEATIVLVGCGGTGGFLAEAIRQRGANLLQHAKRGSAYADNQGWN